MFEYLENIDRTLFLKINGMHNDLLDKVIPILTNFPTWIPLFLLVLYFLFRKYKKALLLILPAAGLMILCADQGANLLKNGVKRYRPTHNLEIGSQVHTVDNYKGGKFGFVSGHAANSFALAIFMLLLFKDAKWWVRSCFILWALLVCYTRIYLGVHYPFDIAGGAIIGSIMAFGFYKLFVKVNAKLEWSKSN